MKVACHICEGSVHTQTGTGTILPGDARAFCREPVCVVAVVYLGVRRGENAKEQHPTEPHRCSVIKRVSGWME